MLSLSRDLFLLSAIGHAGESCSAYSPVGAGEFVGGACEGDLPFSRVTAAGIVGPVPDDFDVFLVEVFLSAVTRVDVVCTMCADAIA